MKSLICFAMLSLMVISMSYAEDKKIQMTTSEAKEKCKKEGKEGQALIDCIKEKKGEK